MVFVSKNVKPSFFHWLLRLVWVFSWVALAFSLLSLWRGELDPEKIRFLFSTGAGVFYLSSALLSSAAKMQASFLLLRVLLFLGQSVSFLGLAWTLVGIWFPVPDFIFWVQLWGIL